MRDALKKINVAKMCNSTNLNVIRIRNYMNGKIAHLRPEEEKTIRDYFNNLVTHSYLLAGNFSGKDRQNSLYKNARDYGRTGKKRGNC